jgi:hypothetical protein
MLSQQIMVSGWVCRYTHLPGNMLSVELKSKLYVELRIQLFLGKKRFPEISSQPEVAKPRELFNQPYFYPAPT